MSALNDWLNSKDPESLARFLRSKPYSQRTTVVPRASISAATVVHLLFVREAGCLLDSVWLTGATIEPTLGTVTLQTHVYDPDGNRNDLGTPITLAVGQLAANKAMRCHEEATLARRVLPGSLVAVEVTVASSGSLTLPTFHVLTYFGG